MLAGGVGYIKLNGFSEASADQFHSGLGDLLSKGATRIVLDLRDNPGGYIVAAQKIASEFVSSGLIFSQESAGGEVKRWEATSGGVATNTRIPVVVLVNGGSASASEIVAAALKELGRATIIGQHTYGKNTVQVWAPLQNDGGVRITISRWFTPDHHSVAPGGVQPDITVEVPKTNPPENDFVLQRALQFLATRAIGGGTSPVPSSSPVSRLGVGPETSYDPTGLIRAAA
jgi:carboxyl-terminal processing protease